jgi:putative membrane protein
MPVGLKSFLQRWVITTLAVAVAATIVHGIHCDTLLDLLLASLLLGILNAFLRPVMLLIALPLVIYTLGLFVLIINGLVFYFVGLLVKGFHVSGFWPAFWGAIIVSLVSLATNTLTDTGQSRVEFKWRRRPPESNRDDGNGPVIDV